MSADDSFVYVRDKAVFIGQLSQALSIEQVEHAIEEAEHSLTVAPFVDPTLFMQAGASLRQQIDYLKAFLEFRRSIETFKGKGV